MTDDGRQRTPVTESRPGSTPLVRALQPGTDDIRALVAPEVGRSCYPNATRAALESVLSGTDSESRALVALSEGELAGLIILGTIAGSDRAGRVLLVFTRPDMRRRGVATTLVDAALTDLRRDGARFVIAEIADDPALAPAIALLRRRGFEPEARVQDFFRDGVDLVILRLESAAG